MNLVKIFLFKQFINILNIYYTQDVIPENVLSQLKHEYIFLGHLYIETIYKYTISRMSSQWNFFANFRPLSIAITQHRIAIQYIDSRGGNPLQPPF